VILDSAMSESKTGESRRPANPNRDDNPQPIRIGRRLTILPAWLEPALGPDEIPIRIEPGNAFGTGTHPTTALCLRALERHLAPGTRLLDLGTGTGILSIAAAKLGAGPVLALDIDPEAVRAARSNVALNHVTEKIRVEQGSLAQVLTGEFGLDQAPLVVANILAGVIVDFFEQGLTRVLPPGGWLVLSGILLTQTPEIRARLQWYGLKQLAQEQMDDWVCIIAKAP
jgi:ribosomal protein L11 methyltransferase